MSRSFEDFVYYNLAELALNVGCIREARKDETYHTYVLSLAKEHNINATITEKLLSNGPHCVNCGTAAIDRSSIFNIVVIDGNKYDPDDQSGNGMLCQLCVNIFNCCTLCRSKLGGPYETMYKCTQCPKDYQIMCANCHRISHARNSLSANYREK